ncbi:WGR domain-containing protein [Roseivivax sediminis]|uniref:WGR domain-containing protein, predicted DNA-binding domain in MolR n=1 Tax=Roseivivax sediminis TaxID=936889 RepID=A0A1I2CUF8_9RHOB|nr:WGR domain-containing protein [Roseivivax sediminis]SFE71350.1 WGR domain-containing protein, predicted DNA-binding domain in MolR [Roseivivax sediminis]
MDLTRSVPEANLHRYYRMEIVPGLFGEWALVREWGRIGRSGQMRIDWFNTEAEAKNARFELHMAKAKRGYG